MLTERCSTTSMRSHERDHLGSAALERLDGVGSIESPGTGTLLQVTPSWSSSASPSMCVSASKSSPAGDPPAGEPKLTSMSARVAARVVHVVLPQIVEHLREVLDRLEWWCLRSAGEFAGCGERDPAVAFGRLDGARACCCRRSRRARAAAEDLPSVRGRESVAPRTGSRLRSRSRGALRASRRTGRCVRRNRPRVPCTHPSDIRFPRRARNGLPTARRWWPPPLPPRTGFGREARRRWGSAGCVRSPRRRTRARRRGRAHHDRPPAANGGWVPGGR